MQTNSFQESKIGKKLNASGSCALQSACWCKLHVCWGGVGAASLPWVCESLLAGCRHHGTASAAAAAARPGGLGASSSSGSIWWRAGGAFRACYLPQRLHQHGARLR